MFEDQVSDPRREESTKTTSKQTARKGRGLGRANRREHGGQRTSGYPLAMARAGEHLLISSMHGGGRYRRQLMDMGLRPGMEITVMRAGGFGPILIFAGETRLGIGRGMAEKIEVVPVSKAGD